MHHAADFECEVGTPLIAVADGVIKSVDDTHRLGAPYMDLLPEANELQLQLLDGGGCVAVYLHIAEGSALVKAGDRVVAGQQLALSGNVGFTTGPHLHFQINQPPSCTSTAAAAAAAEGEQDEPRTEMFAFLDEKHAEGVVPVAGYSYGQQGLYDETAVV